MKVDNVTFYAFSLHLGSDFSPKLRIQLRLFIIFCSFYSSQYISMLESALWLKHRIIPGCMLKGSCHFFLLSYGDSHIRCNASPGRYSPGYGDE